jgi:hypothetical protein
VGDSNRIIPTIANGNKEMTHLVVLAEDFSAMMMTSLVVDLETWADSAEVSQVLLFQAAVWVAKELASKRRQ